MKYSVVVVKHTTYDVEAPNEDMARAYAVVTAEGGRGNLHDRVVFVSKTIEVESCVRAADMILSAHTSVWTTPTGGCCACGRQDTVLPFSVKDYQDETEYHFCSWKCLSTWHTAGGIAT